MANVEGLDHYKKYGYKGSFVFRMLMFLLFIIEYFII